MLIVVSGSETVKKQTIASVINTSLNDVTIYPEQNHLKMLFRDIYFDYNITQSVTYPEGGNYKQFLSDYEQRPNNTMVISGSFSRAFYEAVSKDIEQIQFINITRNPSVVYYIESLTECIRQDFYDYRLNVPLLTRRNISSILNSITLKNIPNVLTVKFEDLINNCEINGIPLPKSFTAFNQHITVEEKLLSRRTTASNITRFNTVFSDLSNELSQSNFNLELPKNIFEHLPSNTFDCLGYAPLELEDIV
jgi:hypothetical protein